MLIRTLAQIANGAADAAKDGVSDEAGVDAAMIYGANYPVGPFAWADSVGRADLVSFLTHLARSTGQDFYRPSSYWETQ